MIASHEILRVFTFPLFPATNPRPFLEDADTSNLPIFSLVCLKLLSPDDEDEGEDNLL